MKDNEEDPLEACLSSPLHGDLPMRTFNARMLEEGARPRDWLPRRSRCKVTFRLLRLCILGAFLPSALVAGPIYLRYRVYSEQLYPLAASDQRLIDAKVSTTWCQSQVIRVNATFNAYLMSEKPKVKGEILPVSMTRRLILEDDMKEYWGFYLLRGSSVTVSTCVRWPGASLTIIRGHKHLHECAFIGDDSSEELEELMEVVKENAFLSVSNGSVHHSLINQPDMMKRAGQGVHFLSNGTGIRSMNVKDFSASSSSSSRSSHELDAKTMKNILTQLFMKTHDTKRKLKENPHHHYQGVYRELANIDKPPEVDDVISFMEENHGVKQILKKSKVEENKVHGFDNKRNFDRGNVRPVEVTTLEPQVDTQNFSDGEEVKSNVKNNSDGEEVNSNVKNNSETTKTTSAEVFEDVLKKINSMGKRGKQMLRRLMDEIDEREGEGASLMKMVNDTMNDDTLTLEEKLRKRRDIVLSSPLQRELTEEEVEDTEVEKDMLHPDGIAEDRGTVDERTLNDKSNSEFWSSFSSSEERLLECKGLILNLPLTPHRFCTPRHEREHSVASFANTVTYRVPVDGYYFFVFNSENEVQPNYLRVQFELLKTVYNTSNPVHACENSTKECALPFKIFSNERTVLELPLSGNDSQWNEEYVVVSVCEPRTSVYLACIILVPLLILTFAFH